MPSIPPSKDRFVDQIEKAKSYGILHARDTFNPERDLYAKNPCKKTIFHAMGFHKEAEGAILISK